MIYEDTWEDKDDEKLPYLKNGVLLTAFCYARYAKGMEELTGFGMRNNLTLSSLADMFFNSFEDEKNFFFINLSRITPSSRSYTMTTETHLII